MAWPPGPAGSSDPDGLTVRDVCDVVYGLLLARVERQCLALQGQHAAYEAAGSEMQQEWPSLGDAQANLDALLDAEPDVSAAVDSRDRELFELMGVA